MSAYIGICTECKRKVQARYADQAQSAAGNWVHATDKCAGRVYLFESEELAIWQRREQERTAYQQGHDDGYLEGLRCGRAEGYTARWREERLGKVRADMYKDLLHLCHPDRNPEQGERAERVTKWLTG